MTVTLSLPTRRKDLDIFSPHWFSVEEYHRLLERAILSSHHKVELIHGRIVKKMGQNPPHSGAITRINRRLSRLLDLLEDRWCLRVQCPITLTDSEPEPDFAIVPGPESKWDKKHPLAKDIALLIEVADSSLLDDRQYKGLLYAGAKVREFWLVNLVAKRIEVYTKPKMRLDPHYQQVQEYSRVEQIPLILGGQTLVVFPVKDWVG